MEDTNEAPTVDLSMTLGSRGRQVRTTFRDMGALAAGSILRLTAAGVEPTLAGLVGASLGLLRHPYVALAATTVLAEKPEMTLADILTANYASQLSAIYGDVNTVMAVRRFLERTHMRQISERQGYPAWFVEATKGAAGEAFRIGDPALMADVALILAAGMAQAHQYTGLIEGADAERRYLWDLHVSVGIVTGASLAADSIRELLERRDDLESNLMGPELVAAAGLTDAPLGLIPFEIVPGRTIGNLADGLFPAFGTVEDRTIFGLGVSPQDLHTVRAEYRELGQKLRHFSMYQGGTGNPPASGYIDPRDIFTVSLRGQRFREATTSY